MKKEKPMEELRNFEKIKLSDDEKSEKSRNSKSSKSSGKASDLEDLSDWSSVCSFNSEWKIGSDENFVVHDMRSDSKRIKLENEVFTCLDDCINSNFNYESIRSRLVSQAKNKNRVENNNSEDLIPIVFCTIVRNVRRNANDKTLEKANEKILRILLDSGASASIIHSS